MALPALLALIQAAEPGVDLGPLAQYGVLGVFAALLIVFALKTWKRETDRGDRLETENQRLNNLIQAQIIPALTTAVTVMQESQELLRDMQRELGYRRQGRPDA